MALSFLGESDDKKRSAFWQISLWTWICKFGYFLPHQYGDKPNIRLSVSFMLAPPLLARF